MRVPPLARQWPFAIAVALNLCLLAPSPAPAQWVDRPATSPYPLASVDQFLSPVGDPADFSVPAAGESDGFRLVRGLKTKGRPHRGVDLSNRARGSVVRAPADGLVLEAGRFSGWGNLVVIAHRLPGGEYVATLMAHLQKGSMRVRPGDLVLAGDEVGRVGNTGRSTGPHVHFEVRQLGFGDPRLLAWREGRVLDPLHVLATDFTQSHTPGRSPSEHWGWAYLRRVAGLGGAIFGLGDPDAVLTRREFYSWTARATGDSATLRTPAVRVESRLAALGLQELLSGVSTVANTIDRAEAVTALGELAAQGWLRPIHPAAAIDSKELSRLGLTEIVAPRRQTESRDVAPRRPLTRAEGALLILAAQTQTGPATASR